MAAIIGAFLAGLAMADYSKQYRLQESARPIMEFLAPFFFVFLGKRVNVRTFLQPDLLGMVAVICVLAILGKLVGCGLGALYYPLLARALKPGGRIVNIDYHKRKLPVGPRVEMKIAKKDVIREFEAAGFRLAKDYDFLKYQYFLVFER